MTYQDFKNGVLNPAGQRIGDGQCVSLVVNSSRSYIESLFPGVSWTNIIAPVQSAKQMAYKGNAYIQWVTNDHNNPNQLPSQGAIMIFGATPAYGYSNTYSNPDGHTGLADSVDNNGYYLLQQNAPAFNAPVNITHYAWNFRPCIGWYVPILNAPSPAPQPLPTAQKVHLPPSAGSYHLYYVGSTYNPNDTSAVKGVLRPDWTTSGLDYPILGWIGDYAVVINSQDYGKGVIWVQGTQAQIS